MRPGDPASAGSRQEPGGDFARSLKRGQSVIRNFGADPPALTLCEVAQETGLKPGESPAGPVPASRGPGGDP